MKRIHRNSSEIEDTRYNSYHFIQQIAKDILQSCIKPKVNIIVMKLRFYHWNKNPNEFWIYLQYCIFIYFIKSSLKIFYRKNLKYNVQFWFYLQHSLVWKYFIRNKQLKVEFAILHLNHLRLFDSLFLIICDISWYIPFLFFFVAATYYILFCSSLS